MSKIKTLADSYGTTIDAMLERASYDSVAPSICINPGCDYTTEYEPDSTDGYCEVCGTNTVKSCLVLVGVI